MKIRISYFAYLLPGKWRPIIEEQLTALSQTSLYDIAEKIEICVNYDDEQDYQELCDLLKEKWEKIRVSYIINTTRNKNTYEYIGFANTYVLALSTDAPNDTIILYFHSKGMTSNLPKIRRNLFEYTIQNYQEYLDAFEKDPELDISGYLPHKNGFVYFNFFWVRASYIINWTEMPSKYDKSDDRFIWEIFYGNDYSYKSIVKTWSPLLGYDQIDNKEDETWREIFKAIHD